MSVNATGGPLAMLRPIVSLAFAAFTWIVAFPIVWLAVRRLQRPKKEDARPLK
jgi:ABC-type Co2+ transport system permease subunit